MMNKSCARVTLEGFLRILSTEERDTLSVHLQGEDGVGAFQSTDLTAIKRLDSSPKEPATATLEV